MNKYIVVGIIGILGASHIAVFVLGDSHGFNRCAVKEQKETLRQIEAAREEESAKQEKVNAILQNENDKLATINIQLADDVERLRERASRRHMPKDTGTNCEGTTGASLSGQDARFLVREAARADILRSALAACYAYADTVAGKQ